MRKNPPETPYTMAEVTEMDTELSVMVWNDLVRELHHSISCLPRLLKCIYLFIHINTPAPSSSTMHISLCRRNQLSDHSVLNPILCWIHIFMCKKYWASLSESEIKRKIFYKEYVYVYHFTTYDIKTYSFRYCKIATDNTKRWYIILTVRKIEVSSNDIEKVGEKRKKN